MKEMIAQILGIPAESITNSGMVMGLGACAGLIFLVVFWCKELFGGEKKLKPGEKYTYRKLPSDGYDLDKILKNAREEKDYATEFIAVLKINRVFKNTWTYNELFRFYYYGIGTNKNEKKALKYLNVALKQDYAPARYSYGCYLRDKKNYQEAAAVFYADYLKGQGNSSFGLYKMMVDGLIETDDTVRFQALFVAKEQGIPEATAIYDSCIEHRRYIYAVEGATEKKQYYDALIAKRNDSFCDSEDEKAIELIIKGHWFNKCKVAHENDRNRAGEYILRLALTGNSQMQTKCGAAYAIDGVLPKNDYFAFIFVRAAARQGDPQAMYLTGSFYRKGTGTPKNENKSNEWFQLAAGKGEVKAYPYVAAYYYNQYLKSCDKGSPQEEDLKEFLYWTEKGIEAENTSCILQLGRYYEDNKWLVDAWKVYARGVELGDERCKEAIKKLDLNL